MNKGRYVIERLVRPEEYTPVSDLMRFNNAPIWKETAWRYADGSSGLITLRRLKRKYGHEYRLVCHGR